MNRVRLISISILLASALLLLPASAQETPPAADKPAAPAEEADTPPDLGENVSADNSVSFPVDI